MKNLLAATFFLMFGISASHAQVQTYETGLPDVYIKHVDCSGGSRLTYSLVNRSKDDLAGVYVHVSVIDEDGDPVDSGTGGTNYLDANTGVRNFIGVRCDLGDKYKFTITK